MKQQSNELENIDQNNLNTIETSEFINDQSRESFIRNARTMYEKNYQKFINDFLGNVYKNNTEVNKIVVPNKVTIIQKEAFMGCINLSEVVLPEGLKEIGNFAFKDCVNLKKIIIPESVTTIGDNAFENCVNLQSIILPLSIINLGTRVFLNCSNLKVISRGLNKPSGWQRDFNYASYDYSKKEYIYLNFQFSFRNDNEI